MEHRMTADRFSAKIGSELSKRIRSDFPIYLTIVIYALLGFLFLQQNNALYLASDGADVEKAAVLAFLMFPGLFLFSDFVLLIHRFDRRRKSAFVQMFSAKRLSAIFAGSLMLVMILFFQGTFTSIKNTLVVWSGGFQYDEIQANMDAAMHFGTDPWRYLRFMIDWRLLGSAVRYNYGVVWFFLSFGIVYFVASSTKADKVRNRYLATFMLVWILVGNVFAGLFMSAGPAFYGKVTGDYSRFGELLAMLAAGGGEAAAGVNFKAYLWQMHESGQSGFGSGISAFPSVHVGLTVMNTLFAYEANRRLGHLMALYAIFILASSVALGWHYAIDGYAAAIIVCAVHFAMRAVSDRMSAANTSGVPAAAIRVS
jgi:PAP2 superfamily